MAYSKSAHSFMFSFSVFLAILNANECRSGVERRCFSANDDIIWKTCVTYEAVSLYILLTYIFVLLQRFLHTSSSVPMKFPPIFQPTVIQFPKHCVL
jgi:hypothetical protein